MYCTHCAKHINEDAIEAKRSSFAVDGEIKEGAEVQYVCPRCGHLIHAHIDEAETKSHSRAAHAQIQRGRNSLATGLGMVAIGAILDVISTLFFFLACKPSNQNRLVTNCAEFYVFLVLGIISTILLATGAVFIIRGGTNLHRNHSLLRDINNGTFVQ